MFFLIDKPLGVTSFDVIRSLRKNLGIKKMGHAGTLDPLASGCLLIATGNSTKLLPLFDDAEKEYIFTVCLDGRSESLDRGTPIEPIDTSSMKVRTDDEIYHFLLAQKTQMPPKYSALHIDGRRAYDLARNGETFELKERPINIKNAIILRRDRLSLDIQMTISSGGYIRSFAPLIGNFMGVEGGYIDSLRRTKVFSDYVELRVEDASSIDAPIDLPFSKLFHTIHTIEISDYQYADIVLGRALYFFPPLEYIDGNIFFLKNSSHMYTSLCSYENGCFTIMRNNV